MDEDALRAMLPMGFGKQKSSASRMAGAGAGASTSTSNTTTNAPSAVLTPQAGPSRPIQGPSKPSAGHAHDEDDESDDGLTAEERAANRAAPATDSDDDSDDDGLTAEERAANRATAQTNSSGDASDSDDEVDLGPEPMGPDSTNPDTSSLPLTSQVNLTSHTKPLTALSVDPSGARIATGSHDYDMKLWDFGGMTSSFKPFNTIDQPFGNYWINDLAWSHGNGEHLLAVSGTAQAKLFDRNGIVISTYKKGDVYLRDMKQTSGHVAEITSCSWLPNDNASFATASADSTIRYWDVENPLKQKLVINVKSKERGARTKVTSHAFTQDGKTLAAGCADGALHLWSTSGSYSSPNSSVQGAHEKGCDVSSVVFSRNGRELISRSTDHTLKLWDVRSFKKPLAEKSGLPNNYSQTNAMFSPDDKWILTGTSSSSANGSGSIEILSTRDLSPIQSIPTPSSTIRLEWHSRINQLFSTQSSGSCCVHYSPTQSIRGALLCINKTSSKQARGRSSVDEVEFDGPIITPGAMDAESRGQGMSQAAKRRRMAKERQDPQRTMIPQRPLDGPGRGGRIGSAATKHVVQDMHKDYLGERQDPREALLKYAEISEKDPKFTVAWKKNSQSGSGSSSGK